MGNSFNSEDLNDRMAGNLTVGAMVEAVRAARAEADTMISNAADAEVAFQETIVTAIAAHAKARALDDAVKAKLAVDEEPPYEDLINREDAEQAARAAAGEVAAKSEVVAKRFRVAAEAVLKRAKAEAAYLKAVTLSEGALDKIVDDVLGDLQ